MAALCGWWGVSVPVGVRMATFGIRRMVWCGGGCFPLRGFRSAMSIRWFLMTGVCGWWGGLRRPGTASMTFGRSADGLDWAEVTDSAGFSGRGRHQVVSYGGSLWLSGGI